MDWKLSVFSDGTEMFLNPIEPKIGDMVRIRLRLLEASPISKIYLRYVKNGKHELALMHQVKEEQGLVYLETAVEMTQSRLSYQFYLLGENQMYFYTARGLYDYLQDETWNFTVLADYHQPAWVKDAVFYQIFPERFCNGREELSVKSGEFIFCGYPSTRIEQWMTRPEPYEQAHCLDFYGGDLYGIIEKIPYLKKLGVTALYLNPIFEAPSVHKYDCIDYFHIDPHLGGDEALAELSKALHENDMRLILDISINHTGTAHKWFNRDGLFFDRSVGAYNNPEAKEREYYLFHGQEYEGWYGVKDLPVLDFRSRELRDILYLGQDSVLRKWLRPPYSIDGWRFDVADVMANNGVYQLDQEVWREIYKVIKEENPEAYILAEDWGDCAEHLQGDQWDAAMNYYGCGRLLRSFFGLGDPFLASHPDFTDAKKPVSGEVMKRRLLDYQGKIPYILLQNQFNLIDSHDIGRMHTYKEMDPKSWRGAVIGQFTLPGTPSIYYGDEAGIEGWTGDFEGCRFPMPWGTDFQSREAFLLHSRLAKLRREHSALRRGSFQILFADGGVFAFARYDEEACFLTILSNEENDRWFELPLGLLGVEMQCLSQTDALGTTVNIVKHQESLSVLAEAKENYLLRIY